MQPTYVVFQSPDHDAVYANGQPKVVDYRVVATTSDPASPSATIMVPKNDAVTEGADRKIAIETLMAQLPGDFAGLLFVRPENPSEVGAWGTGQSFLKTVVPHACNVVAVI